MSKCDDDIILEAYLNKHLKEDFNFFEGDLKNDKKRSHITAKRVEKRHCL